MIPDTKNGLPAMASVSAMQKAIRRGMEKEAMQFAVELMHTSKAFHSMVCRKPITSADGSGCMSKRSSIMLEEVIKLHRFAGISPEKALTEAGRLREAMVAADQSMVIRCSPASSMMTFMRCLQCNAPSAQPRCCEIYLTSHRPRRSNAGKSRISYCHAPHRPASRGSFTFVCVVFGSG